MIQARIAILALATLIFAVDDVFEDMPSPFDGLNVFVGVGGQAFAGNLELQDDNTAAIISVANTTIPKGFIEASYNYSNGLWITGYQVSSGLSAGEWSIYESVINDNFSNKIIAQTPLDFSFSAIKGFIPNPSTLIKARAGVGTSLQRYKMIETILNIKTTLENEKYSGFLEGGISTTVNLLTTWGVEIGIDGRYSMSDKITISEARGLDDNKGSLSFEPKNHFSWVGKIGLVYQQETPLG